jgi:chorismate mutase
VKNIEDWRRRIDEIDQQLVELLNERSQCAMEIGHIKQQANLPLYQPEREKQVLANAAGYNRGPLPDTAIMRLFERILDEARSVERHAMKPGDVNKEVQKKNPE